MSTVTASILATVALNAALLQVRAFVRRFVVLSADQEIAVTLWIAHTHAIDAADCTPYLQIGSATKRAGKTRLLELAEPLVKEPWLTGRSSAAALVRNIDGKKPTLLLDESDAAFNGEREYAEALRGVLNTGYRRSGKATICVGQGSNITVRDFRTFCPKMIAGIGKLPDTVADRAIPISMRRRTATESCERWRERDGHREAKPIKEALGGAVTPLLDALREARPSLPDGLSDRQIDVWEPLLALADAAGGDWPRLARVAARALHGSLTEDDIIVELLRDIREILADDPSAVLTTKDLITKLVANEDRPWATFRRGDQPLTGRGLAQLLRPLGIHPDKYTVGGEQVRGYRHDTFDDAIARYLPIHVSMRPQANSDGPESAISICPDADHADTSKPAEASIDSGDGTHRHIDPADGEADGFRLRFV